MGHTPGQTPHPGVVDYDKLNSVWCCSGGGYCAFIVTAVVVVDHDDDDIRERGSKRI